MEVISDTERADARAGAQAFASLKGGSLSPPAGTGDAPPPCTYRSPMVIISSARRNISPVPSGKRVRPASLAGDPLDPSAVASTAAADRGRGTHDVTALRWTPFLREPNRAMGDLMRKPPITRMLPSHTPSARARHIFSYVRMSKGAPHDYPRILGANQRRSQASYLNGLRQRHGDESGNDGTPLRPGVRPLLAANLTTFDCEAYCDSLNTSAPSDRWARPNNTSRRW